MKPLVRILALGAIALCSACAGVNSGQLAADEGTTATEIALCQERARSADAGDNLHTYNECMASYGLHDGGAQ